jgi:DNA-3-methyladenine glycosylase
MARSARLRVLGSGFYDRSAETVARDLLGRWLVRETSAGRRVLRLVETEAYLGRDDPASHAYRGETARNRSMFGEGGRAYVYFVYGMHFCVNVVCGPAGLPHAVLLRAGEPVEGAGLMLAARGIEPGGAPRAVAGGPARLCDALAIDRGLDGADLRRGELRLVAGEPVGDEEVVRGPRIGVDYAGEAAGWPLRFGVAGSAALSRPFTSSSARAGRGRRRRASAAGAGSRAD